jgi:hypothetical protein
MKYLSSNTIHNDLMLTLNNWYHDLLELLHEACLESPQDLPRELDPIDIIVEDEALRTLAQDMDLEWLYHDHPRLVTDPVALGEPLLQLDGLVPDALPLLDCC